MSKLGEARGAMPLNLSAPASPELAGRPSATAWWGTDWARFTLVAAEFGLLVLIIRLLELESQGFGNLALLAWVGFVIHHFLPLRLRMLFFVALSLAGIVIV